MDDDPDIHAVRSLLAAFPEAVLVVQNGAIVAVNRRLCTLLDADRETLVGTSFPFRYWPPEYRHEHEQLHAALAERGHVNAELVVRASDGRRIAVLASGNAVPHRAGEAPAFLVSLRDISARREIEDRLVELASRDPLTALLNEWGFEERLAEEIARARATGRALSVALIHFEGVDIADVVNRFRADLRAGEQISRTSERELALILPETNNEGARAAVERARGHVERAAAEEGVAVTISAGICELQSADYTTLYALAHHSLERARRGGGATVVHGDSTAASATRAPFGGRLQSPPDRASRT